MASFRLNGALATESLIWLSSIDARELAGSSQNELTISKF